MLQATASAHATAEVKGCLISFPPSLRSYTFRPGNRCRQPRAGGLGVAASGCYGDDYAYFESAHGTAPDIAGRGIINPTATILSAAMILEYLVMPEAALRLRSAIERVYAATGESLIPDQGCRATTQQFLRSDRETALIQSGQIRRSQATGWSPIEPEPTRDPRPEHAWIERR